MPDRPPMPLLRPFQSGEYVQNEDGSVSTERTITIDTDGGFINVPTLWKGPNGQVLDLAFNEDLVRSAAQNYAEKTGYAFSKFESVADAVAAAQARSEHGGAFDGAMPPTLGNGTPPTNPGGLGGLGGMQ